MKRMAWFAVVLEARRLGEMHVEAQHVEKLFDSYLVESLEPREWDAGDASGCSRLTWDLEGEVNVTGLPTRACTRWPAPGLGALAET